MGGLQGDPAQIGCRKSALSEVEKLNRFGARALNPQLFVNHGCDIEPSTFTACIRVFPVTGREPSTMGDNQGMKSTTYLRGLLVLRHEWMEQQVLRKASESGYTYITPGLSRLFAHMWNQPVGLSELARRMSISRQGVSKLASEAARRGLVEFVGSTDDARVVMIKFTAAGWEMSGNAARDFEEIDRSLSRRLGADRVKLLKEILEMPWDADEDGTRSSET